MFQRLQTLKGFKKESCFLWGPRQTGKSTLLKSLFPDSPYYDLLQADVYQQFLTHPEWLRQEITLHPPSHHVIIDEVQKVPLLLDEVQWLMTNTSTRFILCGSSARKLKRGGGNLLGGRALRYELYPLVSSEIPDFDLLRTLQHGLLPRHYVSDDSSKMVDSYIGDYLKEEIVAEALTRNIPSFIRFLEVASFSNGEVINFLNIARECGVSAPTAREYFQILEDTLVGRLVYPFRKRAKRRVIQSPKFYFFDVGIVNGLRKRGKIDYGSDDFGRVFEHFFLQELWAHRHYSGIEYEVTYWRTASQLEVDFILGEGEVAVEIKGTPQVQSHHLRNMAAFCEEYKPKRAIVVSMDKRARKVGNVEILPWRVFLEQLWGGKVMK